MTGGTITLQAADGHSLSAYRAGPETAPGLVVVQEIFGVNAHMRRVCEELASAGYRAIAPTLFDRVERGTELGYAQEDIARGLALRAGIPESALLADVEAAAAALGGRKVGIIGYCWGGTIAWWGATRTRRFAASVAWYGGGIAASAAERPNCPVQMHFGDQDTSIPPTDIARIRAAQPQAEIFVYENARHGFGCEERPSYDATHAALALKRSLAFLETHLG